jgi:hypothetical protein
MIDSYEAGASMLDVAKEHGLCVATIRSVFLKHDVALRSPGQQVAMTSTLRHAASRRSRVAKIGEPVKRRYQSGESLEAIATSYRVAWRTIKRILLDQGVPLRSRSEIISANNRKRSMFGH